MPAMKHNMYVSAHGNTVGALAVLLVCALITGCGPDDRPRDLDDHAVDPFAGPGTATVLLFVAVDCPISNRYAPEIQRIHEEFQARGVDVWLVYPNADDSVEAVRAHLDQFGLGAPALRDPRHALVRKAGATMTPEAVVYAGDGTAVYRGRIDNWYAALSTARPAATEHDLRDALESVLAGERGPLRTTQVVGCYIADPG
jgi:hypothetical protein